LKTPTRLVGIFCALFVLSSVPSEAATYVVDRLTDANPAGGGEGSNLAGDLRFAIGNAQSGDGIAINLAGTILLAAALPVLTRDVCIQGPGANVLTVDGLGGSVFAISSGTTVFLSGLTVTGGSGNGGGIFNQGTLTLNNDTIRDNTAGDPTNGDGTGAGIWNYVNATLTLNGCTVSGNSAIGNLSYAPSRGGGVANDGTLTLNNSTVSGNSATQGFGGGISNTLGASTLTLINSTISENSSPGTSGGGGLDNRGTLIAKNSIVAGNTNGDLSGDVTSEGYNLFGTTNGSGFGATDLVNVTPLLGLLQNNGGPTATMAPLPGSPAIDRIPGTPGMNFLATDQRGVSRPQGTRADRGAVEVGLLSQQSQRFTAGGGAGWVQVSTRGNWTARSDDPSWVTITSGSSGSGGGTVTFAVAAQSGASARETTLTINDETFAVLQGGNYLDVPPGHPSFSAIGKLSAFGVTVGCGGGNYCPDAFVSREQMAAFLVRVMGISSPPAPLLQRFEDVPPANPFHPFIEQIALRQIMPGCGSTPLRYCPSKLVSREEVAAFLSEVLHASGNWPSEQPGSQRYQDVPPSNPLYAQIDEMAARQIIPGCSANPPLYCGKEAVTRAQVATFLIRALDMQAQSAAPRMQIIRTGLSRSTRLLDSRGSGSVTPCSPNAP
jgi:hypothetical protein